MDEGVLLLLIVGNIIVLIDEKIVFLFVKDCIFFLMNSNI